MSGARKSKPAKLKDSVKSEGASGFEMTKFLGRAANMAVVVKDEIPFAETHLGTGSSFESGNELDDKTMPIGAALNDSKTVASQNAVGKSEAIKPKKKSSAKWIDPNAVQTPIGTQITKKPMPEAKTNFAPALMLFGALGLISYVVLAPSSPVANQAGAKLSPQQLQERIEFHRKTTGWKLNNERIGTQIDNHYQAPNLPYNAQRVKPQDMMKGLPLDSETNIGANAPDKTMPVNPSYADARIMYGLQEEQNNREAEQRANEIYMKEFIENAAADGYQVLVDKDGTILEAKKASGIGYGSGVRGPAEEQETGE